MELIGGHPDPGRGRFEPPTGALVVRAQRGDPAALERLVERYLAALTGFCRRLAGTHGGAQTAQDLVQETLLRAVVSLARLQEPERFEAWLFGIAANVARKRWRREQHAPLSLDADMAHPDAEWVAVRSLERLEPLGAPRSPWETPETALELAERAREVERAVAALPKQLGQVLALHYADGLSYAEIAVELDVPVSTVKGRLFKSRRRLRLALGMAADAPSTARPANSGSGRTHKKGTTMQVQTRSHDAERLIAAAEERIGKSANFYQHWFGKPMGVDGLAEDAKEVIRRAAAESEGMLHNYLGTEHVLLGLLGDEAGMPARALAACGVGVEDVRELVGRRIGRGKGPVEGTIGFVPRVKTVVEMATDEARRLGASAVGADHLLLGLLREGGGIGALVIATLGADVYDVRNRALAALDTAAH